MFAFTFSGLDREGTRSTYVGKPFSFRFMDDHFTKVDDWALILYLPCIGYLSPN